MQTDANVLLIGFHKKKITKDKIFTKIFKFVEKALILI